MFSWTVAAVIGDSCVGPTRPTQPHRPGLRDLASCRRLQSLPSVGSPRRSLAECHLCASDHVEAHVAARRARSVADGPVEHAGAVIERLSVTVPLLVMRQFLCRAFERPAHVFEGICPLLDRELLQQMVGSTVHAFAPLRRVWTHERAVATGSQAEDLLLPMVDKRGTGSRLVEAPTADSALTARSSAGWRQSVPVAVQAAPLQRHRRWAPAGLCRCRSVRSG